jgi:PAS domain S-box-containing protein
MDHARSSTDELQRQLETLHARVTELEGAEAEHLQAEEAMLLAQFTIDQAAMAIFWIGPDARVLRVNDAACRSLEYSREQLLSKTVPDFDPDFPQEKWPDHWRDLRQRGSVSFESHHRAKSGKVFPVEVFANFLEFQGREYNVAFARDITDRKRAEEALRESEARLRQIANTIDDVCWITGWSDHRILFANPAYEKVWGRSLQDLYDNPKDWADAIHPDDRQRAWDTFVRLDQEGSYDEEYRVVRPDGSVRWIRDRGFPIRDDSGQVYRVAGIARDVTDRKRAQDALRTADRLAAMGTVVEQVVRCGRIVEDLLGFARSRRMAFARVQINSLIKRCLSLSRSTHRFDDVEVVEEYDAELPETMADAHRLEQVFINIIRNAGDILREATRVKRFTVRSKCMGEQIRVEFTDTGPGIADPSKVFDPFYTAKFSGEGTGLGLSVSLGIVQDHGGSLTAENTGHGARFVVTLPVRPPPSEAVPTAGGPAS